MKKRMLIIFGIFILLGNICICADENVFLLSYFKDNGQDGVFLAYSEDGIVFKELNGDRPIFTPPNWKDQNLTRDPSIVYHDKMFRMVWTSNWTGSCFGAASSRDLKTWSKPIRVQPFVDWPKEDWPRNVWAPEVHWNSVDNNFLILWSSATKSLEGLGGHNSGGLENKKSLNIKIDPRHHRTFCSSTSDFEEFSKARVFFNPGVSQIDACMAYDNCNTESTTDDRWIMAIKHEQFKELGGKNIRLVYSTKDLFNTSKPVFQSLHDKTKIWTDPIVGLHSIIQSNHMVEGPTLLQYKDEWRLYFDRFDMGSNRYGLAVSNDLHKWIDRTEEVKMPTHARHGTIFRAPKSAVGFLNNQK
jgi:hypothetical protein